MPTSGRHSIRRRALGLAAVGLAVAVAACTITIAPQTVSRPDVVYEPDVLGPVSDGTCDRATDTCTLTVDGETFEVGPEARSLYGGDNPGGSDTLLLYGAEDDTSWFANLPVPTTTQRAGCGALDSHDAWDDGDSIVFAFTGDADDRDVVGIRLPKSDDWEQVIDLEPDGRYPFSYNWWCIDLQGRVEAVYPGGGA